MREREREREREKEAATATATAIDFTVAVDANLSVLSVMGPRGPRLRPKLAVAHPKAYQIHDACQRQAAARVV